MDSSEESSSGLAVTVSLLPMIDWAKSPIMDEKGLLGELEKSCVDVLAVCDCSFLLALEDARTEGVPESNEQVPELMMFAVVWQLNPNASDDEITTKTIGRYFPSDRRIPSILSLPTYSVSHRICSTIINAFWLA